MEANSYSSYSRDESFPPSATLEGRKTTAAIDPVTGTAGAFVAGPSALRPGPFAWNSLAARGVAAGKFVRVQIEWDGLGSDAPAGLWSWLARAQQQTEGAGDAPMAEAATAAEAAWRRSVHEAALAADLPVSELRGLFNNASDALAVNGPPPLRHAMGGVAPCGRRTWSTLTDLSEPGAGGDRRAGPIESSS